jgi:hypothetical protein
MVDDGVGLGQIEVGIEAATGRDDEFARVVVEDGPVAVVRPGIARPHDPDRVRCLVNHEVVGRREWELFGEVFVHRVPSTDGSARL